MSTTGAITPAILSIRDALTGVLAPYKWTLTTAENPFQKLAALNATGDKGLCVVAWKSDAPMAQATRSLVIRASLSVTLVARRDLASPALGKLQGESARLFEIHDRVKGALLSMTLPSATCPQPGAEVPIYGGSVPLATQDGVPLDAIEQTWEVELGESFAPEATQ